MRELAFDVVVVGAGPAGLAAAVRAAESGRSAAVADDNPASGGQIWRAEAGRVASPARPWLDRLRAAGGEVLSSTSIVHAEGPDVLYGDTGGELVRLRARRLVLATGARERFLPFPGWTLPGVYGAGGLQALVKGGLRVDGKRVVVAGSGPLLLAVAAALRTRGAKVVCVAEQAPLSRLTAFAVRLLRHPRKLVRLAELERTLLGTARYYSSWPVRVTGDDAARSVTLGSPSGRERTLDCDAVACGFGLVPDTRLASFLGCHVDGGRVAVDAFLATSVDGVYCAGEPTGVGGVDLALVEGEIAGLAAAGRPEEARGLFTRRRTERRFADALERTFALCEELSSLPEDDTVVCRCEDTTWSEVRGARDLRDAKLRTRCGMGPCQGRVCGPALGFLCGFEEARPRPPLFPVALGLWAEIPVSRDSPGGEIPKRRNDMTDMSWAGVMPAITTPFREDMSLDLEFLAKHCVWLVDRGATGIIPLGSLGEGATLSFGEKVEILETCVRAVSDRVPVVSAVSALSTREAVEIARAAEKAGCRGLMVLPPYVHKGPWYEIRDHFSAVLEATPLEAMIYNNPIAYGTDLRAEHVAELAERHPNVAAVKESSGDARRVTALAADLGERLALFVGLDDMIVEGVASGAVGWVAGLVNALPEESIELFRLARDGKREQAFALYRWFLPLLRLDTVPEFVQLIKLVQQEVGMGSERVRAPRQPIRGEERERVLALARERLEARCLAA